MTVRVGKFSVKPAIRYISRWEVELLEPLAFRDPKFGVQTVPAGTRSDLASIRVLREICRWAAALSAIGAFLAWGWVTTALMVVSIGALALYGIMAGYGVRAAILHDHLYATQSLSRSKADAVYYRALRSGDGAARWRAAIAWLGVRVGGRRSYGTK